MKLLSGKKGASLMRTTKIPVSLVGVLLLGLALTLVAYTPAKANQKREGLAGSSGTGRLGEAGSSVVAAASLNILYRFSGATDDGQQGSPSRREATSVLCTNIDDTHNVQVEVQIIQWNGTDVYTGSVNMPPNTSYTYSTQNTAIYFDDVILGGSPGTPAIYQGSGRILSSNPNVICTVEVLDPLNYPPVFMDKLTLFDKDGNLVGDQHNIYLPLVLKS